MEKAVNQTDRKLNLITPLSASLIDYYLQYFFKNLETCNSSDSYIFPTNFYEQLCKCNFEPFLTKSKHASTRDKSNICELKSFLISTDVFNKNHIFIPMYDDDQWCMAVVCFLKNYYIYSERNQLQIVIFDPRVGARRVRTEHLIKCFLEFASMVCFKQRHSFKEIKVVWPVLPHHDMPVDSSVIMLQCIHSYFQDPINFYDDTVSVLHWFCSEDIKYLVSSLNRINGTKENKNVEPECKNYLREVKIDADTLSPCSSIKCKNCGHMSKYMNTCEKCGRTHSPPHKVISDTNVTKKVEKEKHNKVFGSDPETDHIFDQAPKCKITLPSRVNEKLRNGIKRSNGGNGNQVKQPEIQSSKQFNKVNMKPAINHEFDSRTTKQDDSLLVETKIFPISPGTEYGSNKTVKQGEHETYVIPDDDESDNALDSSAILLTYPARNSKDWIGAVSLHLSDYECLHSGEMLNDAIVEFYLRYMYHEKLSENDKKRTFIFNTYFYQCLTKPIQKSRDISDEEQMYANVKNWTKNVDIFEKDFLIVPVNCSFHWILAVICFPGLENCVTIAEGKPASEKSREPIKQPCILILDSMSHISTKIADHLLMYLKMEYKHKKEGTRTFDNFKKIIPDVPNQSNSVDCGVFILQFAESFFKNPIENFKSSLSLEDWFPASLISKKRGEIATVVRRMMKENNIPMTLLPSLRVSERKHFCDTSEVTTEMEWEGQPVSEHPKSDKLVQNNVTEKTAVPQPPVGKCDTKSDPDSFVISSSNSNMVQNSKSRNNGILASKRRPDKKFKKISALSLKALQAHVAAKISESSSSSQPEIISSESQQSDFSDTVATILGKKQKTTQIAANKKQRKIECPISSDTESGSRSDVSKITHSKIKSRIGKSKSQQSIESVVSMEIATDEEQASATNFSNSSQPEVISSESQQSDFSDTVVTILGKKQKTTQIAANKKQRKIECTISSDTESGSRSDVSKITHSKKKSSIGKSKLQQSVESDTSMEIVTVEEQASATNFSNSKCQTKMQRHSIRKCNKTPESTPVMDMPSKLCDPLLLQKCNKLATHERKRPVVTKLVRQKIDRTTKDESPKSPDFFFSPRPLTRHKKHFLESSSENKETSESSDVSEHLSVQKHKNFGTSKSEETMCRKNRNRGFGHKEIKSQQLDPSCTSSPPHVGLFCDVPEISEELPKKRLRHTLLSLNTKKNKAKKVQ